VNERRKEEESSSASAQEGKLRKLRRGLVRIKKEFEEMKQMKESCEGTGKN